NENEIARLQATGTTVDIGKARQQSGELITRLVTLVNGLDYGLERGIGGNNSLALRVTQLHQSGLRHPFANINRLVFFETEFGNVLANGNQRSGARTISDCMSIGAHIGGAGRVAGDISEIYKAPGLVTLPGSL